MKLTWMSCHTCVLLVCPASLIHLMLCSWKVCFSWSINFAKCGVTDFFIVCVSVCGWVGGWVEDSSASLFSKHYVYNALEHCFVVAWLHWLVFNIFSGIYILASWFLVVCGILPQGLLRGKCAWGKTLCTTANMDVNVYKNIQRII